MRYLKATTEYLLKSAWLTGLICLAPSVILAVYVRPMASITFLPVYAGNKITKVTDIISLIFGYSGSFKLYAVFLIFISLLMAFCICIPIIEKHFRVGRLSLKKPMSKINETFLPVLKIMLIMTLIVLLYTVILLGVVTIIHYSFSSAGIEGIMPLIISTVATVIIFVVFVIFTGPVLFMMPLMITYGFSFGDAISEAYSMVGKKNFQIILGGIFPYLAVAVIEYIASFFNMPHYVSVLIAIPLYLYLTTYTVSFIMVVMYDIMGLERRDKAKIYG